MATKNQNEATLHASEEYAVYTKPPYVDTEGKLTPLHPRYMAEKAKAEMNDPTVTINGAPRQVGKQW